MFILTFISTSSTSVLCAQQRPSLDVSGLKIGSIYNYSSVTGKFGQPTSYWSGMSEDGLDEEYYFGTNLLRFQENGMFSGFVLEDNRFAIYTSLLNGGIKVGDQVNKFQLLGFGYLELQANGTYYFKGIGDIRFEIKHSNGTITMMLFSIPD